MKCIYAIRHILSGRAYVGSAVDRCRRWKYHKNRLRRRLHHSGYLQNAWNLYGEEAFEWVVLEDLSAQCEGLESNEIRSLLVAREHYWTELHRALKPGIYNLRAISSSNLGVKYSEESKARMSAWQVGKKHSKATKEKLAAAKKGRELTPEHRENIRRAMSNPEVRKKMSVNRRKRSTLTEAHKQKIGLSVKGQKRSKETREKISQWQIGKKLSEETKRRISEAQKARFEKLASLAENPDLS